MILPTRLAENIARSKPVIPLALSGAEGTLTLRLGNVRLRDLLFSLNRLAVRLALLALRFYKIYLSALIGGTCRFEPTCSVYAYEAVERLGLWRGCWLTLKRLLRCHPLSRKFGYDPVPEHEAHS